MNGELLAPLLAILGGSAVLGKGSFEDAALTAFAVMLAAWRTRLRRAPDWYASIAAAIVTLAVIGTHGRSGALGWLLAGAFCLGLDRDSDPDLIAQVLIAGAWTFVQGGAFAAVLAILNLVGTVQDRSADIACIRRRGILAGACVLLALAQLAAPPFLHGEHSLYLDLFAAGRARPLAWNPLFTPTSAALASLVWLAALYGLRRRGRTADAVIFVTLGILALTDARNVPYFAIACAPIVADSVASYYLPTRTETPRLLNAYAVNAFATIGAVLIGVAVVLK